MTRIEADKVTIRRGGRAILDSASLNAHGGEFIAVIGANGAGKSTLLAALSGLMKPDGGTIAINGKPLAQITRLELAKARAYLPQNPRCEWPIPVERLVALGLTPLLPVFGGLPPAFRGRIDTVLAACDLTERRDQAATTLSGGELSRAMLARALVGDPDILLVDEPMAGLDPRHVLDTVRRLKELAAAGKLVIAAVHDLTLAARYATRLFALHRGRMAADGPPAEVLTPSLIRGIFDVEAAISGVGGSAFVDYLGPVMREENRHEA
jgi:iron complex transport system ATP-binding protein